MHKRLGPPSLLRRAFVSFLLGTVIFSLGVLLEHTLGKYGIKGTAALLDNLLVGILAGFLVFAYERRRHQLMLRQMRVIAEMNHHIRNALQPIVYSPYMKEQAEQIRVINEGTQRIQWALREVLAGEAEDKPNAGKSSAAA